MALFKKSRNVSLHKMIVAWQIKRNACKNKENVVPVAAILGMSRNAPVAWHPKKTAARDTKEKEAPYNNATLFYFPRNSWFSIQLTEYQRKTPWDIPILQTSVLRSVRDSKADATKNANRLKNSHILHVKKKQISYCNHILTNLYEYVHICAIKFYRWTKLDLQFCEFKF